MLDEENTALQECYYKIISTIDVDELVPILFQEKVIPSNDAMERILNTGITRQDKAIA